MKRFSDRKIIIVKRKTRLEEMIIRFNTIEQARFYITAMDGDFEDYVLEDKIYNRSLKGLIQVLEPLGNVQVIDREFLPNFMFGKEDIVAAIGQDGIVANVLKYLDNQPLIGVNPDPDRYDGVLLPFLLEDCSQLIKDVIGNKYKVKEVTMAKVSLNNGQSLYAVNDFYIGHKSHVSFRYQMSQKSITEYQSSSGIIISTGLGSTGWMKSVLTGAGCILKEMAGVEYDLAGAQDLSWDRNSLMYSVREPFMSRRTSSDLVFGTISSESELCIQSQTSENGVIFSDGIESDFLEFNAGITATIGLAEKKGRLVY